jgi:acyl-CoA reductase-like NAD-dependent aldehyde dehydrogenase
VLKASERSPRCFWAIGSIFNEAGLPSGTLNVVAHRPEDASEIVEAMIAHPMVKKINFTGSTSVGRTIAAIAGKHLKPVLMELGGKASSLVLEDADLKLAAHWNAVGAFLHVRKTLDRYQPLTLTLALSF